MKPIAFSSVRAVKARSNRIYGEIEIPRVALNSRLLQLRSRALRSWHIGETQSLMCADVRAKFLEKTPAKRISKSEFAREIR